MQIKHEVQRGILKQLLLHPKAKFSNLNQFHLDNNHFNFHLRKLIEDNIVEKHENFYQLTINGKELAGRMNINTLEFVRQPKVGVSICVLRDERVLLGKRLRDPGIGVVNFYTRKVSYFESIYETARVCLAEETGLEASFKYVGTERFLEREMDRLMICLNAFPIGGKLNYKTNEAENNWYSFEDALKLQNILPDFNVSLLKHLSGEIFFEEIAVPI